MDINNSEVPTLSDLLEEIKKLREDVGRHEKLLEQIIAFHQQHELPVLPAWSPDVNTDFIVRIQQSK